MQIIITLAEWRRVITCPHYGFERLLSYRLKQCFSQNISDKIIFDTTSEESRKTRDGSYVGKHNVNAGIRSFNYNHQGNYQCVPARFLVDEESQDRITQIQ